MNCSRCGGERPYYPLSDKPDPGYQQRDHTPSECVAELLADRRTLISELLTTLQYPDVWEKRVQKAMDYLLAARERLSR